VDLPAHETVEAEVPRDRSGAYARYCGKPFHPTMGMRGALELPWPFGRTPNLSTALRQERPVGGTLHSLSPENVGKRNRIDRAVDSSEVDLFCNT
jgi:hypothetical protein